MQLPNKEFIEQFKKTNGAFGVAECIALYNIVLDAPSGKYCELGVYKGKSAMAAALGLKSGTFYLIEPEFGSVAWEDEVYQLIKNTNPNLTVITIDDLSLNIIPNLFEMSYVFVDSSIHDDMVMKEARLLQDKIKSGGILAFHDLGNQFTAVQRAYDFLVSTGKLEPIIINWKEIFDYVRENNLEEGNISWHSAGSEEFPKFVGALKRK